MAIARSLRSLVTVAVTCLALSIGVPNVSASDSSIADQVPTTNEFLDLERDLSECISSNPLPGCGREPTSAGDRGGWQQLLLFGIMMGGIAAIFWRIAHAVRSRDRRLAEATAGSESA